MLEHHVVPLDIVGARFHVLTPDDEWEAVIRELWAPFVSTSRDAAMVIEVRSGDQGYVLSTPADDPVVVEDPWLALLALRTLLDEQTLRVSAAVDLHASLLARGEDVLLLPGTSGVGKTSLSMYLATHGWSFGGDDVCPLDVDSSRACALPRPIGLRSVDDLPPDLWSWPAWLGRPRSALLMPAAALPKTVAGEYAPASIAFVRFVPDRDTTITSLSVGVATARLSGHVKPLTSDVIPSLGRICSSARACELIYRSVEEAAMALVEWSE